MSAISLSEIVQIRVPRIALIALNPDVGTRRASQEDKVFVATAFEVRVLDVVFSKQRRVSRFDVCHA